MSAFMMFHCIVYDFVFLFDFHFGVDILTLRELKTLKTSNKSYPQLKEFINYKTNNMASTFNYTTINCNQIVCTRTSIYMNCL